MTSYRYQLDVSDNFSQLSSCLANNALLSQLLFSKKEGDASAGGGVGLSRLVKREEGTARSCSDPLSFASFLAFALAVANLMMGNGRRRKKRSPAACLERDLKDDLIMATSTILTGAVFSYDESGGFCRRRRTLCDTGNQLRQFGDVGRLMAEGTELLDKGISEGIKVGDFYQ